MLMRHVVDSGPAGEMGLVQIWSVSLASVALGPVPTSTSAWRTRPSLFLRDVQWYGMNGTPVEDGVFVGLMVLVRGSAAVKVWSAPVWTAGFTSAESTREDNP